MPVRKLTKADGARLKASFENLYEQVYGHRIPNQAVEAITWSVTVSSRPERPKRAGRTSNRTGREAKHRRLIYDPPWASSSRHPCIGAST